MIVKLGDPTSYFPGVSDSGAASAATQSETANLSSTWAGDLPLYGVAFNIIGAVIILICYLPGTINSVRNRQTQDMSWGMWNVTVFALLMLSIFAACGIGWTTTKTIVGGKFIFTFICEFGCFLTALTVWLVKLVNVAKAKHEGITEKEWCEKFAQEHPNRMKSLFARNK